MPVLESIAIPLWEIISTDQVGTKAFHLAKLFRNGLPIPETLVLPADSEELPGPEILDVLGGCIAVRSSATAEDLADASFAGQFASILNVRTPEELAEAIRAVRASARSEAVRAYCAARGIDPAGIRVAVILQRMVKATTAGVLFTVDPVSGREDDMLIEACPGLADGLLAGRESGVRIPVRNGEPLCSTRPLSAAQVRALVAMGQRIQALKGCPQDIEWAIEGGWLFVLQARPITRLCFGGIEGEWTNADFRDGGVAADVVTPLMWSLYESVWGRALKGFLKDLRLFDRDFPAARLFYGRPYWNLAAVKRCAAKLPGFVEREFDRDLAVEPRYSGDGVRTPVTLWNLLRALPTAFAARRVFYSQEARDRELLAVGLPRHLQADLRSLNDHKLLQTFRELIEGTYRLVEENYFRTIFCASIAKLDFRSALGNLPLSYAALVGGLDDLEHFACTHALWQFANWPRTGDTAAGVTDGPELKAFLTQYGHHSRRELDLRVPRWSEDVSFVAGLARQLVGTEDPAEPNRRRRWQFVAELDKARQLLSRWQWRGFEKKLFRLRNYLWLREQMRDLSARVYALLRRFFLELGRRAAAAGWLHSEGDIFYLRFEEIYQIADIARDDRVAVRRQHERMYRDFRAPNEVGRGFTAAVAEPSGGRLTGIGCSAGVVTGCVRVVTALEQAGKLQPGEILVCPFTDPGWTPLLNVAAGVVTENGGLLSHAAVICREYAIPAVLNVAGATRQLRDGQRIRLDGDHGHVDLL